MKTKAQILLFVLCFFVIENKAQIYFNNQYDATGNFDGTNSIDTFQNKYLTIGIEGVFGSNWGLSCYLLNQDGTAFTKKTYGFQGDNLLPNHGKYIRMGNQFYSCGMWAYGGYKSKAFLWRFKANLDSVKFTSYGFINQTNVVTSFVKHSDNKIYMVGYVDDTLQTNADILLIKTDTAGNELWKKKIGLAGWDENALSIDTLNGNLLIAGNRMPHSSSATQGFVMYLDTAGNNIWQKTITTNGGYGGCVAKKLKDGNVLIYSRIKQYSIGSDDYYRLQVEKITPTNTTLWIKQYNAPTISANPYAAIENKHGNIVIAGQTCYTPGLYVNGVVNEIAQNGDSIFSREYFKMGGSQNYFRDVVQTNDGGYCFAGFIIPVPANGGAGTEDIWLLKVDSNFCESATPCGYGVGLSEAEALEATVRIYPNPANEVLNIEFSTSLELTEQPITIEITNTLGQVVLYETLIAQSLKLNTSNLQSGLYYLSIKTKDKTMTRKIMIMR